MTESVSLTQHLDVAPPGFFARVALARRVLFDALFARRLLLPPSAAPSTQAEPRIVERVVEKIVEVEKVVEKIVEVESIVEKIVE